MKKILVIISICIFPVLISAQDMGNLSKSSDQELLNILEVDNNTETGLAVALEFDKRGKRNIALEIVNDLAKKGDVSAIDYMTDLCAPREFAAFRISEVQCLTEASDLGSVRAKKILAEYYIYMAGGGNEDERIEKIEKSLSLAQEYLYKKLDFDVIELIARIQYQYGRLYVSSDKNRSQKVILSCAWDTLGGNLYKKLKDSHLGGYGYAQRYEKADCDALTLNQLKEVNEMVDAIDKEYNFSSRLNEYDIRKEMNMNSDAGSVKYSNVIEFVKNSTLALYPNKKIGQALSVYFIDGKWYTLGSASNTTVVFQGKEKKNPQHEVALNFIITQDKQNFYLSVDNKFRDRIYLNDIFK